VDSAVAFVAYDNAPSNAPGSKAAPTVAPDASTAYASATLALRPA
jgi:hypothetical protein